MKNKNENEKILWWKEPPQVLETKFGRARIYTDGYYRISSRKEGNHLKFLHRLIFEDFYRSPIPEGFHVHHINENKLDNRVCNLKLLRASEHRRKHKKGSKLSMETRKKISDAMKGSKHPMYNKKHSLDTRKKISEAKKGSKHSLETRKKISEAKKGSNHPNYKNYARVVKDGFDKNGKQQYSIKNEGKKIKKSINRRKLEKEVEKINQMQKGR